MWPFHSSTQHRTPLGHQFGRELNHSDHKGLRKLVLIRHGQIDFNIKHLLPGQLPGIPLNETGREEARTTAAAIRKLPLTALIASPLERTMETASIVNEGRGLIIQQDRDLIDTDYGKYSGQNYLELDTKDPQWQRFVTNGLYAPKGVESFVAVQKRVVRAAERWRSDPNAGEWVGMVTHADPVKMIIAHYMGIPIGNVPLFNLDNASVSLIVFHPQQHIPPTLLSFNWTSPALWLEAAQKN